MADKFSKFPSNMESPAKNAFAVTPNNSTDLAVSSRAIYVGGAGNMQVSMVGDGANTVIFTAIPAGSYLPLRVARVWAGNTTATSIVALY